MANIGIVGGGIAGLHLGLFLRQHGIDATIYTEKTSDQQRGARLSNIVIRNGPTRARERRLGVNHWDSAAADLARLNVYIGGPRPIRFSGVLREPAMVVDMRIYWARLLEDFAARGGRVVIGALQAGDIDRLAAEHDLVVVAAGRGSLANMFARLPEHSPYDKPQRLTVGGLYRGVAYPRPLGFDVVVAPGHGEILAIPLISFEQGLTGLAVEIIPGGAFELFRHLRYEDDPRGFESAMLGVLREYAPEIYARVDPRAFGLARPLDLAHVAITPTVRRGYLQLANGKFALALGDAHVLNDPLTGQGANTASHAAWALGEAIRGAGTFDAAFCRRIERQIWSYARSVTEACNARLGRPQPHTTELLAAAAHNQAIADAYADGFNHPDRFWEIMSSPARTAALLEEHGWQGVPAATPA
jgi:2-polyprenyl-6-methoxyphenol hydroxylase-like FAD-dependent oxidoreductase